MNKLDEKEWKKRLPKKYSKWTFLDFSGNNNPVTAICPNGHKHRYSNAYVFRAGRPNCKECLGHLRENCSFEEWRKSLPDKYKDWYFSNYNGSVSPIVATCPNGHTHTYSRAYTFKRGDVSCQECKGKMMPGSGMDAWLKKLPSIYNDWFFEDYKGTTKSVIATCPNGHKRTFPYAYEFSKGRAGCSMCHRSSGEKEIYNFVKSLGFDCEHNNIEILPDRKELDVYCPKQKIAFEFNGLFHHSTKGLMRAHKNLTELDAQKYHKKKTEEAKAKGITLYHIFGDEWENKREIVEDKIKSILKYPCQRIYARNTVVSLADKEIANNLLEKWHIQGRVNSGIFISLEIDGEIVAIQSFSQARSGLGGEGWVLERYATKLGICVVGGFSKCLAHFINKFSPSKIISYGDLRMIDRDNNVYLSNGFKEISISRPSYYYVRSHKRHHRFAFRKDALQSKFPKIYDEKLTEFEIMDKANYLRIYDCGKVRYELDVANGNAM